MVDLGPPAMLHVKGKLVPGINASVDNDIINYRSGSVALVKFLEPISPMLNYFEYKILDKGTECAIGIGLGPINYPQGHMPGWERNGIGYHADDGKLFHERGYGVNFGPSCTQGDRMGCGVDFDTDTSGNYVRVFFTKNGKKIGNSQKMKRPVRGLYPMFGLHSKGESIQYLGHWHVSPDTLEERMSLECSPSTYWIRSNGIRFLNDGLTLEYAGEGGNIQDCALAQANIPLSPTNHYFELEILDRGANSSIAIGLAKLTYPLHRHPGWNTGSIGYHADDGKVFKEVGFGKQYGPTCSTGDVMGCGISFSDFDDDDFNDIGSESDSSIPEESFGGAGGFGGGGNMFGGNLFDSDDSDDDNILFGGPRRGLFGRHGPPPMPLPIKKKSPKSKDKQKKVTVYFTKNGERLGGEECVLPSGGFYPVVAMLSLGEKVRVNLFPFTG